MQRPASGQPARSARREQATAERLVADLEDRGVSPKAGGASPPSSKDGGGFGSAGGSATGNDSDVELSRFASRAASACSSHTRASR